MESKRWQYPCFIACRRGTHLGSKSKSTFLLQLSFPTSDVQKGSLPVSKIKAHNSKIYGIDWSHDVRNEIVTCSLDKTIKVWDISDSTNSDGLVDPKVSIQTTYPVWRARNLPFGHGLLSLAQRGVTALEMYAQYQSTAPVETFEGHKDVVKEFVWRRGGQGMYRPHCSIPQHWLILV